MALVLADRVRETTDTTGTGTVTLNGAVPGYQSFGVGVGGGNTTYYAISDGSQWEVGLGTYTASGTTLSRDTVLDSSNSGSLVNFAAGTKSVFVTYPADKSVSYDASGNVNIDITGNAATATSATSATSATTATNLASGAAGSIPYQSGSGATTFLATGTGVIVNSGGSPSYSQTPTLTSVTLTSGTVSTTPSSATDLVNKEYVDTLVSSGITYHAPVDYEVPDSTGNLNATYNNGTSGVGATLTNAGTLVAFTPDGTVAQVGDRILIYNQTNQFENGIYEVTTVGDGATAWVLTRTTDADSYGLKDPNALGEGDAFFVRAGDTGAGETYVCNTTGTITFGTTAITFTQVAGSQVYTVGTGLTLSGTEFSITNTAVSSGSYGAADTVATFAVNAQGQLTSAADVSIAIAASQVTSGTLPVARGGTGASTLTSNAVIIGNGTSAVSSVSPGTAGNVLTSDGSAWVSQSASGGASDGKLYFYASF